MAFLVLPVAEGVREVWLSLWMGKGLLRTLTSGLMGLRTNSIAYRDSGYILKDESTVSLRVFVPAGVIGGRVYRCDFRNLQTRCIQSSNRSM